MARRHGDLSSDDGDTVDPSNTQLALQVVALRAKVRNIDDALFGGNGRTGTLSEIRTEGKEKHREVMDAVKSMRDSFELKLEICNSHVEKLDDAITDQRLEKAKIIGAAVAIWSVLQIVVPFILSRLMAMFATVPAKP